MRRLLLVLAALLAAGPARAEPAVGFVLVAPPLDAGAAVELGIWFPAEGAPRPMRVGPFVQPLAPAESAVAGGARPLVVMSHGTGGSFSSHADTAWALASAGFVVAAPSHPGDNHRDGARATDLAGRVRLLSAVARFAAEAWRPGAVDPGRVGAFGFSSGGFTVLAAAGGVPDLARLGPHCAAHPEFFDCRLMRAGPTPAPPGFGMPGGPALRALVVAAPALGFAFGPGALDAVRMPVQLWEAGADAILPAPHYAAPVRAALPAPPEFHHEAAAGHFDFLAPCSPALEAAAPAICGSAPGFDRAAFHARFNAEVARFLLAALAP